MHPHPQFFQLLILRPPILRPFIPHLHYILKAHLNQHGLIVFRTITWPTEFDSSFEDQVGPFLDGAVLRKRGVVVFDGERDVFYFEPTAGIEIIEALFEAPRPVGYAADHHTHVDEVKFVLVLPGLLDVVDFELAIWWYESWLDGT